MAQPNYCVHHARCDPAPRAEESQSDHPHPLAAQQYWSAQPRSPLEVAANCRKIEVGVQPGQQASYSGRDRLKYPSAVRPRLGDIDLQTERLGLQVLGELGVTVNGHGHSTEPPPVS